MNRTRMWLALATAAWFALSAAAAPAPAPPSEGPISDALRLRGLLAETSPPLAGPAVMVEEGVIEVERLTMDYRQVEKDVVENVVLPGGKVEQVTRKVVETVGAAHATKVRVAAKSCKFFSVTKDGKLEALDAAKAAGILKNRTPVLTGESADVDPRNLELIKPGTLYVVFTEPQPPQPTPPPPREDKP